MPGTERDPFRRIWVDHLVRGSDRIFWEMERDFHDPKPWVFQLQVGNSGNANATDWINVGSPIVNGFMAVDDEMRPGDYGKSLTTHYRLLLTTPVGTYVSNAAHLYGVLKEKDWCLAREIVRKESLRHGIVSRDGYLLKKMRYGEPCTDCTDPLTGAIINSQCPECGGTGFKVGWYPPVFMKLDMTPEAIHELRKGTEPPGASSPITLQGRILGFPHVEKEDVWVDGHSDQRWSMDAVYHLAEWYGVPLIIQVDLKLLPFSDVIYKIPVGGDYGPPPMQLPQIGQGTVVVDHNYGGDDELTYQQDGVGVVGATILIFDKCIWDAHQPSPLPCEPGCAPTEIPPRINPDLARWRVHTRTNGRWEEAVRLCPCRDYVLVYELPGKFGPDIHTITVLPEEGTCEPASSSSSSARPPSSISSSSSMGIQ